MSGGVPGTSADAPSPDFGAMVDCWLEGMRSATGNAGWTRRAQTLGAVRALDGVLMSCAPAEGDRLEWARTVASEYARANAGASLSVFGFQTWLQSGKPARRVNGRPVEQAPEPIVVDVAAQERAFEEFQRARSGDARRRA